MPRTNTTSDNVTPSAQTNNTVSECVELVTGPALKALSDFLKNAPQQANFEIDQAQDYQGLQYMSLPMPQPSPDDVVAADALAVFQLISTLHNEIESLKTVATEGIQHTPDIRHYVERLIVAIATKAIPVLKTLTALSTYSDNKAFHDIIKSVAEIVRMCDQPVLDFIPTIMHDDSRVTTEVNASPMKMHVYEASMPESMFKHFSSHAVPLTLERKNSKRSQKSVTTFVTNQNIGPQFIVGSPYYSRQKIETDQEKVVTFWFLTGKSEPEIFSQGSNLIFNMHINPLGHNFYFDSREDASQAIDDLDTAYWYNPRFGFKTSQAWRNSELLAANLSLGRLGLNNITESSLLALTNLGNQNLVTSLNSRADRFANIDSNRITIKTPNNAGIGIKIKPHTLNTHITPNIALNLGASKRDANSSANGTTNSKDKNTHGEGNYKVLSKKHGYDI